MIESHVLSTVRKHTKGGHMLTLGDQIPSSGLGFSSLNELATACGFTSCTSMDYNGKADLLVDLNLPLHPFAPSRTYDLIYDGGVFEHVANIGQAFQSVAALCAPGGIVIHANPLNCYGDSYYALDPLAFHDIYGANGFTTLECYVYYRTGWRFTLHSAALRFLPNTLISRLRFRLAKTTTTKAILLHDDESTIKKIPPFPKGQWRTVPTTAHTLWVGRKSLTSTGHWVWPSQSVYPKANG